MVLEKIISKLHNAFIRGRQILDLVLITNECLDSKLRSRELGVICKMYLEKVYDHINRDFLLYTLKRYGLRGKWHSWIAHFISSVCFSVLVNDTLNRFFSNSNSWRGPFVLFLLLRVDNCCLAPLWLMLVGLISLAFCLLKILGSSEVLIQIISIICVAYSYALKLLRAWRLTWLSQK